MASEHSLRKAEPRNELPRSEERWHAIFEDCPFGIAIADFHGHAVVSNSTFQNWLGYTEGLLPARSDLFTQFVEGNGGGYKVEERHRLKDGSLVWLSVSVLLGPGTDGVPSFMMTIVEDITERKRAEEAPAEGENRFRSLLDNSPNLIFLKDAGGRYLYVNKEFERALGVSREQIIGKKDDEVSPPGQASAFQGNDLEVLRTGRAMKFEEVALQDDGPHTRIVQKFPLLDASGRINLIGGIVTDITARRRTVEFCKQCVERFRLLIEGVQDYAIFALDPEGRVVTWNVGAERIKGYKEEEILGRHFSCFYEQGDIERGKPEQHLEMAASAGRYEDEGWRVRKDGSRFWANIIVTSIRDNHGELIGFSKVTRDLTERKQFERELKHERDRLRLLLDLNNSFASNLDLHQLFGAISAGVRSVAKCDAVVLSLPESDMKSLRIYAIDFPKGKGFLKEGIAYPAERSIASRALETSKPFLFEGVPASLNPAVQYLLENEGLKSVCALPLCHGGSILGVLNLACFEEGAFTQEDVDLLGEAANQMAIAVENALHYDNIAESRERLAEQKLYLEDEIRREGYFGELVGKSPGWKRVVGQVETVAPTDSAVLILGETGTGKELLARAIHNLSLRRDRAYVSVNCASIPAGLLESEMFGHEKGAFTGAIARQVGRVELANNGTLFLDEVGDIPLELQSKLLRVIQEHEFERLGSTRTMRVDFRLVAATNRNLTQMADDGRFRRDLYYRLNVFPIEVPPLRERPEDIPLLVWHFVNKYAQRMNKRIETIRAEDMEALAHYHWPGNVRELQNFIERSVILSTDTVLHRPSLAEPKLADRNAPLTAPTLADAEREHILQTLRDTDWVVGGPDGAAAKLGVKRTTLIYKMRKLGISRPED